MTTSKSKARGSAFERSVAVYIGGKRIISRGQHQDVGDVHLDISGLGEEAGCLVIFECKDVVKPSWTEWLEQTERERKNANARYGFLVWKRRGKGVGESLVVMTLTQLIGLLEG